ncbi:hypothetical protein RB595_001283 [Gaeumannomyces hyphopodioides]
MLSATRRWLRRNRTPIAVGAGVVGAGYIAARYVLGKISDARERMSSDRIAKENLRRRFEQNQEDCTFTVLALLPTAATNIIEAMNTEQITYQIQQMKARPLASSAPPSIADTTLTDDDGQSSLAAGPPPDPAPTADGTKRKTKRQLWDELAVSSITRAYTLLYTLTLLTMFTRIQLNLLGRRSYLSSVVALATGSAQAAIGLEDNDDGGSDRLSYGSDFEINRRYLTLSWWLLNRGWVDVRTRVEAAVARAFGHLSPRDDLSLEAFGALTSRVRAEVETGAGWLGFLLPPVGEEESVLRLSGILGDSAAALDESAVVVPPATETVPPALRRLVDETSDLIDSPPFTHVLGLLLDAGFDAMTDGELAETVFAASPEGLAPKAVQLPKILSSLTRQAHAIGNAMPNRYLQSMESVRDLEAFAAVVYSSNWENEMKDDSASTVLVPAAQASFEGAWGRATAERQS